MRKRYQGTGLGLSIAKSLTELLGGQIGYRPRPDGQGSVFWFTVRLQKFPKTLSNRNEEVKQTTAGSGATGLELLGVKDVDQLQRQLQEIAPTKWILAAEDNGINQTVLLKTLHTFGFKNITMTSNGEQALSELSNSSQTYDLVLMDISMPVMDGVQATIHIRNHGLHLPIIAMTAYALKGDMELCLEKGMDDYISKPVNKTVLMRTLLKWLIRAG